MIEINEEFTVAAAPDVVYAVMSDPSAVIECVQGAELGDTHEDGTFDSSIVIKFSALKIKFLGRVGLVLDEAGRSGTMTASGKDGQGGTKFNVTAEFSVRGGAEPSMSSVVLKGDVELRGKLAGMIEGAATTVTQRMAGEFVEALSLRCASGDTAIAAELIGNADATGAPAPAAVLLHDFAGSPNTLRSWGQALASEGIEVSIPRLPGHGTRWKDLNRTSFDEWLAAARRAVLDATAVHPSVHVMGLGLGGTLALRLAAEDVPIASVVAVNPLITRLRDVTGWDHAWRWLRRSKPAPADDIRKNGVADTSYRRVPLKAAASLAAGGRSTADLLPDITIPVHVVASVDDRIVSREDAAHVGGVVPTATTTIAANSGHVVPLDNDFELLVRESLNAVRAADAVRSVPHDGR